METNDSPKFLYRQRRTIKKALRLTFITLLISFVALEVVIRLTREPLDIYVLTGRIEGPNGMEEWAYIDAFSAYRAIPGDYLDSTKTVNQHGFISTPEIDVEKPDGTIRVLFLGGSSTAGTGANLADEDTWPWQVHQFLLAEYPDKHIEFINGALGGYSTFESYGRFWSRLRFFSPDIVVVYHGWNDIKYFNEVSFSNIHNWRTLPDGSWDFIATSKRYEPLPIDDLIRPSQLLTRIRIRLTQPIGGELDQVGDGKTLLSEIDRRGVEVFRTHLQLIEQLSDNIGAELFVAKQATLITEDLPIEERERAQIFRLGLEYDTAVDAFAIIYDVIDQEIDSDHVIDVTPLSGIPEYFADHIHPTVSGSTEIARIVTNAIQVSSVFTQSN